MTGTERTIRFTCPVYADIDVGSIVSIQQNDAGKYILSTATGEFCVESINDIPSDIVFFIMTQKERMNNSLDAEIDMIRNRLRQSPRGLT